MSLADERWETIKDFPNYMISSESRVLNKNSLRMIAIIYNKRYKYRSVRLWSNGKTKLLSIYRVKAIAFIPNPENKREVNHLDGNHTNEDLSNLQWTTPKENMKHSYVTGLAKGYYKKGLEHQLAKLSKEDILLIRQWYDSGFFEAKGIAKVFGITREHAMRVGQRKQARYV